MTTDPNYNTAASDPSDPMEAPGEQNDTLASQQAQQNAVQSDATASQPQQDAAAQQPQQDAAAQQPQPDPIQPDVVTFVKIDDAALASIVSAITPVIYAQFERILPALQAQGAQTIHDVQTGVVSVIEQQHMSLLSRIEGLLHPAQ